MKKILNIISGIVLYYICVFLFMGYGHTETHVPLNTSIGLRFLEMVSTNAISDKTKFQNYEFNWNNDKQPGLSGPACGGDGYTSVDMPADIEKSYTPIEWISQGGWMEDEPWGPASICHFYDPKGIDNGKKYLTDNSGNVEWLVSMPKEWFSRDAKSWATGTENAYGWTKAKEYVIKALKESDVPTKNTYMAKAYRCLGQTLHLVADMGCPPHVRNDSHPPKISFLVGDPDPYEDICKKLDMYSLAKANSPNPVLATQLTAAQKFTDVFESLAIFTNEKFCSGGTINTDRYKPTIRSNNPYPLPLLSESDYNTSEYAYYKTYDGVKVKMCKDKVAVPFAIIFGKDSTRGRPYLDYECVESMASAIIPNVVEAGANVVRMFVPSLKMEITEAKVDSGGIIRGRVSYTIPSMEDEYSGLFDLKEIYNGPVNLFLNGTDTKIQAIAKKNNFEFKLNGSLKDLKKDDLALTKLDFGGIVLKSLPKNVSGIQQIPVIDSLGVRYSQLFPGYQPWGCSANGSQTICIFGKNWSLDPLKTKVKINGSVVPITNIGSVTLDAKELRIDIPKLTGNVAVSIESEGVISVSKNFYVGIPPEILHKLKIQSYLNGFYILYTENQTSNLTTYFGYSSYGENMKSYGWSGNILTMQVNDNHKIVATFSEDGTKINTVHCEIDNFRWDLSDIPINNSYSYYGELKYWYNSIPASSYSNVSGYYTHNNGFLTDTHTITGIFGSKDNSFSINFYFKN